MLVTIKSVHGSVENIKDIYPTGSISFPLKPTMTMSLGLTSMLRILIHHRVEEKIRCKPDPESIRTHAILKVPTC